MPLWKELLQPFHLTYNLSPLYLYYFFNSKLFLICFLQFFFVKVSNNFFTIKITNNICPWHSVFNLFNHKTLFRLTWNVTFSKNVFIFIFCNMITNFKFRIFLIIFFIKVNICAWPYTNRFHFNCAMICIVVFINYII